MDYKEMQLLTNQKFESLDFKVGDIFSEMLAHWKVIIKVDGDRLTVISGSSKNLKLESYTPKEFKEHCSYKNITGYWIDFMKNDTQRASDYLEAYFEQIDMSQKEIRDFKLDLVL